MKALLLWDPDPFFIGRFLSAIGCFWLFSRLYYYYVSAYLSPFGPCRSELLLDL